MVHIWNITKVKKLVVDVLSVFLMNMNQETTQDSTYTKEIMSKISNIKELSGGIFPISFKYINQYQLKDPILKEVTNYDTYQRKKLSNR